MSIFFILVFFFFSSRRRHTRYIGDWSSDVCSSDLFAHFVNHFSPILLRAVSRKVRSAGQAREIRQETFRRVLTIVQSDHGVRQPESFEVFVIGVCNNVVRGSDREQGRSLPLSELEAEPVTN